MLTDHDLVRQRTGWPDVRIGLSEVKRLSEGPRWLLIESAEPRRRIAIPNDLEKFTLLRSELIKLGPIVKRPRRSPILAIPPIASLFSWALVFLANELWVVKTAACLALALLAWESFSIGKLPVPRSKPYLLWIMLGTSWVAALWIIYSRLERL